MRNPTSYGAIVQTCSGRGEITFPQGGRIQCYFALTEYATGKFLLTCEGRFSQASYPGWERLVHQYRLDSHLPIATAQKRGLIEKYEGRTEDNRHLSIRQMFLINAQASGVAVLKKNVLLQMQFECQDASLSP